MNTIELTEAELATFMTEATSGRFAALRGYKSEGTGDVSDITIQFGCYYGTLLDEDAKFLNSVLDGTTTGNISVKHGVWLEGVLPAGNYSVEVTDNGQTSTEMIDLESKQISNQESKARRKAFLSYSLPYGDSMVQKAAKALLSSILNPAPKNVEYEKEGKGLYSLDGTLYLRDALIREKTIIEKGERKFKASAPATAVKDALRKQMKTGNYRTFRLKEGNFSTLTMEKSTISYADGKFFLSR